MSVDDVNIPDIAVERCQAEKHVNLREKNELFFLVLVEGVGTWKNAEYEWKL